MQMDLCLDLEVNIGNHFRSFFSLKFGSNEKKQCLTRIKPLLKSCHPLNNVATSQEIP